MERLGREGGQEQEMEAHLGSRCLIVNVQRVSYWEGRNVSRSKEILLAEVGWSRGPTG